MTDEIEVYVGMSDAKQEEYPVCTRCGNPRLLMTHSEGMISHHTCLTDGCKRHIEKVLEKQISISAIGKARENSNIQSLIQDGKDQIEFLNEYRKENGLDIVNEYE